VGPERFTRFSMPKENHLGTLIVVVLKARNLNDKHSLYKQDVFAQITLNGMTERFTTVDDHDQFW
jgi:hypothetical protein